MSTFLSVIGVLGSLFCIIWFAVRIFKKTSKKPVLLCFTAFFVLTMAGGAMVSSEKEIKETENISQNTHSSIEVPLFDVPQATESSSEYVRKFDKLQSIFSGIGEQTTIEDLELAISHNSLHFSVQEYNGGKITYVTALSEGAAKQKRADPGDYIEVSFDSKNDGKIMYATYVNEKDVAYSALYYNYGIYFDLSEKEPGVYSGYYINDSFSGKSGIIMHYSNGNEKHTNYFKCDSADDAINKVIDHIEESDS